MAEIPEIDRLIEEGLTLYGQGDLDRALLAWERALGIDPDNEQASSYVDYVRANYDLLTSDAATAEAAPFGIGDDEPDYEIEIAPGEVVPGVPTPMHMDPLDEGWSLGEDEVVPPEGTLTIAKTRISDQMTIANPDAADFGASPDDATFADPRTLSQTLSDGDSNALPLHHRDSIAARLADFDEPKTTEAIAPSRTTTGDLITLELEADEPPEAQPSTGAPEVSFEAPTREYDSSSRILAEFRPDETPAFGLPLDTQSAGHVEFDSVTSIQERYRGFVKPTAPPATVKPAPPDTSDTAQGPPPISLEDPDVATLDRDLPDSGIPSPTSVEEPLRPSRTTMRAPGSSRPPANVPTRGPTTREYPAAPRPPASTTAPPPISTTAPTRDFTLDEQATSLPPRLFDSPLISAPTRDLGLRAAAVAEGEAAQRKSAPQPIAKPDDPDEARNAEILATLDDGAPPDEPKDDRTRRRIMTLFERAASWSRAGDLERAVTAVDLAMSEDPNSALAQKLIHRNRDTIMFVFQGFLGDMNRTPVLARPLHQLGNTTINPRAAFLLSRIDGLLTLEEILDVSGMPRLEAFRYLCQLFLRGILR